MHIGRSKQCVQTFSSKRAKFFELDITQIRIQWSQIHWTVKFDKEIAILLFFAKARVIFISQSFCQLTRFFKVFKAPVSSLASADRNIREILKIYAMSQEFGSKLTFFLRHMPASSELQDIPEPVLAPVVQTSSSKLHPSRVQPY